jgi:hypothetical protein
MGTEKSIVHCYQLNELHVWAKSFKEKFYDPKSEVVLFDVMCGDFNIDNMSPSKQINYGFKF